MKSRCFFFFFISGLSLVSLGTSAGAQTQKRIPLQLYVFHVASDMPDTTDVAEERDSGSAELALSLSGIRHFEEIVQKECGIAEAFLIPAPIEVETSEPVRIPPWPQEKPEGKKPDGGAFPFRIFQETLLSFLEEPGPALHRRDPLEVSIFLIDSLMDLHAGMAFPEVDFGGATATERNEEIVRTLANRILLAREWQRDPGHRDHILRVVAHELAHIFVQEMPPHHFDADRICPETNLLCDVVEKNVNGSSTLPMAFRGLSRFNGIFGHVSSPLMDGGSLAGADVQFVPAAGEELTEEQCEKIRCTIEEMQAAHP